MVSAYVNTGYSGFLVRKDTRSARK
ncbi:unnamed protein product [Ectocarpus sp. CCAP 1310/34]|nr:unnamed protein product [Ectocarpus sp. CCAP 1310/34]